VKLKKKITEIYAKISQPWSIVKDQFASCETAGLTLDAPENEKFSAAELCLIRRTDETSTRLFTTSSTIWIFSYRGKCSIIKQKQ
jgi:hypothetical protein